MSAKKGFETKLREDENTDSGFVSGELSGPCEPEAENSAFLEDNKDSEQKKNRSELDSDLLLVSECFSSVHIAATTLTPTQSREPKGETKVSKREKHASEQKKEQECELDSGIIVSECLSSGEIAEVTLTPPQSRSSDIPPLNILFQQDDDGDTQLHIAAVHGCEKSVSTLIRVCPDKAWLDVPNDYGLTPLHLSVMNGHVVVTRMLVIAGVSLGVRDRLGETPLHKATLLRNVECIQALLTPVPEKPRKLSSVLEQKNYNGQACVHVAASSGHVETLQTLVYYGADINSQENLAGWTALHIAARRGDTRMVQYLRDRCPGVAAKARDYAGRTPRRLARRTKVEKLLVSLKDDSDSESDTDDEMYDSDNESLFEKMKDNLNLINVA